MLPDFARCVDDLEALVTTMMVVQSPGAMPQIEGLFEPRAMNRTSRQSWRRFTSTRPRPSHSLG